MDNLVDDLIRQLRSGPRGRSIGAFFDFDGTLIEGYSAGALYSHRLRNFEIGPAEVYHTLRHVGGETMTEQEFAELMSRGIAGWAGRPEEDLAELGQKLFNAEIAGKLFHEAFRLVKVHQELGHTVAIATSATRLQVEPLARELGIDHVLCTELEIEGGLVTGRLAGRPLWGPGKLDAVTAFARRRRIALTKSHAYANGDEDVPFLACVGNPHAVNPQPELAQAAAERRWPVLEFTKGPGRFDPLPTLRTAALYGGILGTCLTGMGIGKLTGNGRRGKDFAIDAFGVLAGPVGDVQVEVTGQQHAWSHRPAVFLINHQSALIDLVVVSQVLRTGFTAVAKKEVASLPVFGPLFTWLDFAYVDRGTDRARSGLEPALERLREGTSIVISPEGTRSPTPQVGPFRKGAFHLAWQAGVPIVPIVIRNAGQLMWRGAKTARPGVVQVHLHPPIPTDGWTKADLDHTVDEVQRLYVETLADWNAVTHPAPAG